MENTKTGYIATTESDDPNAVAALRGHIRQMSARLESGLMVRRWDPAFAEYVAHYSDIRHRFLRTKKGVRMMVTGKTPDDSGSSEPCGGDLRVCQRRMDGS